MSRGLLLASLNCILALLLAAVTASGATTTGGCFISRTRPLAAFQPHLRQPYHLAGLITRSASHTQQAWYRRPTTSSRHAAVADSTKQQEQQPHGPRWSLPTAVKSLMAAKGGANGGGKDVSLWNLPNILTLMRVFAIPVLVVIFYWDHHAWRNLACTLLFVFAAMTDWLDGYLARRMNLSSPLGAFLDPVADKLMVATALVLMADRMRSPIVTISTAIIINREIGVSALREWMASMNQRDTVAVGWWGKVKTATQMVALSILLYVQPPFPTTLDPALGKNLLDTGVGLLAFSAFLTVTSAAGYVKAAWPALTGKAKK